MLGLGLYEVNEMNILNRVDEETIQQINIIEEKYRYEITINFFNLINLDLEGSRIIRENLDMFIENLRNYENFRLQIRDFYDFLDGTIERHEYCKVSDALYSFFNKIGIDDDEIIDNYITELKDITRTYRRR